MRIHLHLDIFIHLLLRELVLYRGPRKQWLDLKPLIHSEGHVLSSVGATYVHTINSSVMKDTN